MFDRAVGPSRTQLVEDRARDIFAERHPAVSWDDAAPSSLSRQEAFMEARIQIRREEKNGDEAK